MEEKISNIFNDEFESPNLWHEFNFRIKYVNRYHLDDKLQNFIRTLLNVISNKKKIIKSGTKWYRARIGYRKERNRKNRIVGFPYLPYEKKDMLNPSIEQTKEGRINPRGISYLYLSDTVKTAISEIRPWLEEYVSVATCELQLDSEVIDITSNIKWIDTCLPWDKDATKEVKEKRILYDIDRAFSLPVATNDLDLDYVPTQFLAEIFKKEGYKGIIYRSSIFKGGANIVLFNNSGVSVKKVNLYSVTNIDYEFTSHTVKRKRKK